MTVRRQRRDVARTLDLSTLVTWFFLFSGCFEGKSCDAFDFGDEVVFEVPCSFGAVMDFGFAAVAEVDAADEFSDDHDVGAFGDFGFQRRVVDHGVGDADGTEVDVESELFSKAQDGFFRDGGRV